VVRRIVAMCGAVSLLAVAAPAMGTVAKDQFALKGEVYATGFRIEMKNAANRDLVSVRRGTYRIKIEDEARIHNFRLVGPGVNRATSIPRRVETIWTVTLRPGRYRFLCDPHALQMRGSFRVT
jgi:hypothetical protein